MPPKTRLNPGFNVVAGTNFQHIPFFSLMLRNFDLHRKSAFPFFLSASSILLQQFKVHPLPPVPPIKSSASKFALHLSSHDASKHTQSPKDKNFNSILPFSTNMAATESFDFQVGLRNSQFRSNFFILAYCECMLTGPFIGRNQPTSLFACQHRLFEQGILNHPLFVI